MQLIWNLLIDIVTLFVILAMYGVAATKFESIVISGLVLIYLQVITFFSIWARNNLGLILALDEQFRELKNQQRDEENSPAKEVEGKLKSSEKVFIVNLIFIFIFFVIAIFHILINL